MAETPLAVDKEVGSLTLSFNYKGAEKILESITLNGTDKDKDSLLSTLEKVGIKSQVAGDLQEITTGEEYKKQIQEQIDLAKKDKKFLNFNYFGHSYELPDGQLAILLPSIALMGWKEAIKCVDLITNKRKEELPKACMEHLLTATEVSKMIGETPVFGFLDSCFSGAIFASGIKNFSFFTSTDNKTVAIDVCSGKVQSGTIVGYLEYISQNPKKLCEADSDMDTKITWEELGTYYKKDSQYGTFQAMNADEAARFKVVERTTPSSFGESKTAIQAPNVEDFDFDDPSQAHRVQQGADYQADEAFPKELGNSIVLWRVEPKDCKEIYLQNAVKNFTQNPSIAKTSDINDSERSTVLKAVAENSDDVITPKEVLAD